MGKRKIQISYRNNRYYDFHTGQSLGDGTNPNWSNFEVNRTNNKISAPREVQNLVLAPLTVGPMYQLIAQLHRKPEIQLLLGRG